MGYYKNEANKRTEVRRYNASRQRANELSGAPSSALIHMESISETERFSMAQNADRLTTFNKEVEAWQNRVAGQLRAGISGRSMRIARELQPKAYTDKYGVINRLGFSFPRYGIYIHKGAGNGQGGFTGSKWTYVKKINDILIDTSIIRHTSSSSLGKMNEGNRRAYEWFDPVIRNHISELADIVTKYFDTMLIDATRIYITKR